MTEVKPWEPVRYGWSKFDSFSWAERGENYDVLEDADLDPGGLKVTLANSQRVIVRALSEERKAARRMRRDIERAVKTANAMQNAHKAVRVPL